QGAPRNTNRRVINFTSTTENLFQNFTCDILKLTLQKNHHFFAEEQLIYVKENLELMSGTECGN
ncbi:hypothetical protein CDAR_2331, partial [Caerostris darwini]